jgi:hypothetical protein
VKRGNEGKEKKPIINLSRQKFATELKPKGRKEGGVVSL